MVGPTSVKAQLPDSAQVADSLSQRDSLRGQNELQAMDWMRTTMPDDVVMHLRHLTSAFPDTPDGMGLIATGMAEAEIAADYVALAGRDSTSLNRMIGNMVHVLHAIDPNEVSSGFGLGYGFKRAAENVLIHAEMATTNEGASEGLMGHAPYVTGAARGALGRADEAIVMARRVQSATTARDALRLVDRLADLVRAMAWGDDADRDGRVGHVESESGLAQASYHLTVLERMEQFRVDALETASQSNPPDTASVDTTRAEAVRVDTLRVGRQRK